MERAKLPALTSLRFIAAAMVLLHHTCYLLSSDTSWTQHWPLSSSVSLFFVLSGFILTYSYPSTLSASHRRTFLIARFARIWPVHLFCLLLLFAFLPIGQLVSNPNDLLWIVPANVFMIHAWFPYKTLYFSLNDSSWSISTEFFFYLCFSTLISRWEKTWLAKLIFAGLLLLSMILLGNYFRLPGYSEGAKGITSHGLIYIHPMARLFEFVLGMSATLLWKRMKKIATETLWLWSAIEITVIVFVIAWLYKSPLYNLGYRLAGITGMEWIAHSGSCFAYALLIPTLALGRGIVSKALSLSLFVTLGEISYSMYLLTNVTVRVLGSHFPIAIYGMSYQHLFLVWALILWYSYFTWKYIETPSRKWILKFWSERPNQNRKTVEVSANA